MSSEAGNCPTLHPLSCQIFTAIDSHTSTSTSTGADYVSQGLVSVRGVCRCLGFAECRGKTQKGGRRVASLVRDNLSSSTHTMPERSTSVGQRPPTDTSIAYEPYYRLSYSHARPSAQQGGAHLFANVSFTLACGAAPVSLVTSGAMSYCAIAYLGHHTPNYSSRSALTRTRHT